jgi:tetratricopeptide (TPR) repeat protein
MKRGPTTKDQARTMDRGPGTDQGPTPRAQEPISIGILITGGTRADRLTAAAARERGYPTHTRVALDARSLPFTRLDQLELPPAPRLVRIDDIELAFPDHQTGGVRLVLTQSTYLLQKLVDRLAPDDVIIATADHDGGWRGFESATVPATKGTADTQHDTTLEDLSRAALAPAPSVHPAPFVPLLARAFAGESPDERAALTRDAARAAPDSEICALCLASACREIEDVEGARAALDRALQLAPDWDAAHFEDGKFWLAADDMPRARDGFARAAAMMPTFSPAFSNLGATLGELDDAEGAAAAFYHALEHAPDDFTLLNNIGVVERERGRLDASEEALTRVTKLAPGFVFGHYNLGHTRFLRADYAGALAAYETGWQLDSQKNRRQGCRLALVRFANGRVETAEREFWALADSAPPDEREELLLEAYEIGSALLQTLPQLASNRQFVDRIGAALTV